MEVTPVVPSFRLLVLTTVSAFPLELRTSQNREATGQTVHTA